MSTAPLTIMHVLCESWFCLIGWSCIIHLSAPSPDRHLSISIYSTHSSSLPLPASFQGFLVSIFKIKSLNPKTTRSRSTKIESVNGRSSQDVIDEASPQPGPSNPITAIRSGTILSSSSTSTKTTTTGLSHQHRLPTLQEPHPTPQRSWRQQHPLSSDFPIPKHNR